MSTDDTELDQLRAEVERLKSEGNPTPWAYEHVCRANEQKRKQLAAAEAEIAELKSILSGRTFSEDPRDATIAAQNKRIIQVNGFLYDANQIITRLAEALEEIANSHFTTEWPQVTAKDALADLKKWRGGE